MPSAEAGAAFCACIALSGIAFAAGRSGVPCVMFMQIRTISIAALTIALCLMTAKLS